MMLGVPYVLFVMEWCVIVLIFINTKNLLMFLLFAPIHGLAYALTVRDNRFVDILMVWTPHPKLSALCCCGSLAGQASSEGV